jgi:hypothetical protein
MSRIAESHSASIDPFWKLSCRLPQLQPDNPEIVGGSGASKWDSGDNHDTVALLGRALIKHLRSTPASNNARINSGLELAGPSVATILALRFLRMASWSVILR